MNGNANMLLMWVFGEGAELVDTLSDLEVLQGAALLLRFYTIHCCMSKNARPFIYCMDKKPVYLVTNNYTMGQNFLNRQYQVNF